MAFEFGSGFSMGGGFSMKPTPPNPLDSVEYTEDLQADSLAELEALRAAMNSAPREYLVVILFADRQQLDSFMWRRHLPKESRFVEGEKAARLMGTPQANAQFSAGKGFSLQGTKDVDADAGWVERAKNEKKRFTLATDPEYYCVLSFDSDESRSAFLQELGLDKVQPLDLPGQVFLPGPEVDAVLA